MVKSYRDFTGLDQIMQSVELNLYGFATKGATRLVFVCLVEKQTFYLNEINKITK